MTGLLATGDVLATPRVDVDDRGPERVFWLRTADVCLGVVPALGGRVLSLVTRAGEHLFRNPDLIDNSLHPAAELPDAGTLSDALGSWLNWGGDKTWPAPQGWSGPDEWPGPPDPVLDGGPYSASWTADRTRASIEMCSPDDLRSGLRICRRVDVTEGVSGYRLTSTFTNTSDRAVRWAIWQVVQLPGSPPAASAGSNDIGLGVWVGSGPYPGTTVEDIIVVTERVQVDRSRAETLWVPPQDVVGKVGFPTAAGWVAHAGAGRVTVLRFSPESGATYPDRGSRVEVWLEYPLSEPLRELGGLRPGHRVVECEILGPLRTMPPGSSTQMVTDIAGCSGEGPVRGVQADACLLEPLVAVGERSRLHVAGRIGVFRSGPVTLDLLDPAGGVLRVIRLGQISAGACLEVSLAADAPSETTSVVLHCGDSVVAHEPVSRLGEREVHDRAT